MLLGSARHASEAYSCCCTSVALIVRHAAFAADVIEAKAKVCATCHGENGVPS